MSNQSVLRAALQAGLEEAARRGSPSSIAILDGGRNLIDFSRMEGAVLASIEISQAKAFTAGSFSMDSGALHDFVQPGAPFFGLQTSHRSAMVTFGGGVPVVRGGKLLASVGVAGGTTENDIAVAMVVKQALEAGLQD